MNWPNSSILPHISKYNAVLHKSISIICQLTVDGCWAQSHLSLFRTVVTGRLTVPYGHAPVRG